MATESDPQPILRKPAWLKIHLRANSEFTAVRQLVQAQGLHTVCESAHCPNLNDCWGRRTATFMLLGDVCTRNCRFCAVGTGRPAAPDPDEPEKIAAAVRAMQLQYVVLTSVTRDDLPDGGAEHWAATLRSIRRTNPECTIEVLVPDFQGDTQALATVLAAHPDVVGHNLETVPELYNRVRPRAHYRVSLELLERAQQAGFLTKTGIMVGLGETDAQLKKLMHDATDIGCAIMTIGQYLQPTPRHLPVARYVELSEYAAYRRWGLEAGLKYVYAGPLVRSSYHAEEVVKQKRFDDLSERSAKGTAWED